MTQSQPDLGICCQFFSSLSSGKNLQGISAPGQQDHWSPLEAKHWGVGDVTLQRVARHRIDPVQTLAVTEDFAGGSEKPRSWQVSWSPQCPALLAGVSS